jgi:acyl-coenzyme A thioesterase PaaI-like protein
VEKQPNSRMCFVCGIENPIGLKFYTDDGGRCIARFQPKPEHQGYPGHLHGGIISTLLAMLGMSPRGCANPLHGGHKAGHIARSGTGINVARTDRELAIDLCTRRNVMVLSM